MSSLKVITVPREYLSESDLQDWQRYAVVLGDCVFPGFILGGYFDRHDADVACRFFADHYGLKAFPLDDFVDLDAKERHTPRLRLIRGGASLPPEPKKDNQP